MTDAITAFINELESCRRVLVTTHVRPDGDALGTTAALVLGMRAKGIEASVLLLSHLPSKYGFVYTEHDVPWTDVEAGFGADFSLDGYDALLVADTGTWSQLPGMQKYVEAFGGKRLVLDHHLTQQDWATTKLVKTTAAAAGEITAELLERWGVALTPAMATCLFVALVSDTGWFQFSNTSPHTLRMAADLVEAGVDTDRVYQLLYQNERPERVMLQTRALASLQILAGDRLAIMTVRATDFAQTKAGVADTEAVINVPLQIKTVAASVLLTEPTTPGGPVRISFRSKGAVDVAAFAQQFGGGGHARAAGAKYDGPIDDAVHKVTEAMTRQLEGQSGPNRDAAEGTAGAARG